MSGPTFDPAEQRSAGWLKARNGCLTASKMAAALGSKAKQKTLMIEIVAERLTDCAANHFVSQPMKHGIFWEEYARRAYEVKTGEIVRECGFALHPTIEYFGASPDGLVGSDGLVEIKCPTATIFTKYAVPTITDDGEIIPAPMPTDYIPQMDVQLSVTGRKWCDFVAYFPSDDDLAEVADQNDAEYFGSITMPESLKIKVWRYTPTAGALAEVEEKAIAFLAEVDALFDQIVLGGE